MQTYRLIAVLLAAAAVGASGLAGPTTTAPAGAARPAQRLTQEHARVSLANMPLHEVLTHYGKLSGLTIKADWDALKMAGITRKTPVTLKAYGLTFEKLLDLTLDSIALKDRPLAWYLSADVVHVSTQMRVLLRDRPIARAPARAAPARRRRGGLGQINFDQTPLRHVIEFIRDYSGLNIHVNWRSLEATGITQDTPVTLKARGISLRRMIDLVMDQLSAGRDRFSSVYWIAEDRVVQIATGDAFNRTTRTQIYDVSDVLMVVPSFQGPRISLQAGPDQTAQSETAEKDRPGLFDVPGEKPKAGQSDEERRREMREGLIETIKLSIGEEMWMPNGKGSIRILKGRLIITQTPLGFKLLQRSMTR